MNAGCVGQECLGLASVNTNLTKMHEWKCLPWYFFCNLGECGVSFA